MELSNEFEVPVPVEQAWLILTDLERIAPCLPGAQLQEVEGDVYRGIVKIKVGPITAQYKGQAVMVEKDDVPTSPSRPPVVTPEGPATRRPPSRPSSPITGTPPTSASRPTSRSPARWRSSAGGCWPT